MSRRAKCFQVATEFLEQDFPDLLGAVTTSGALYLGVNTYGISLCLLSNSIAERVVQAHCRAHHRLQKSRHVCCRFRFHQQLFLDRHAAAIPLDETTT